MRFRFLLLLSAIVLLPACTLAPKSIATASEGLARSQSSGTIFDPSSFKRDLAIAPTQVMIFGLGHLDGAPDNFKVEWLEPILCRLRSFKPDVILTEAMPGEQVMNLDAYAAYHGDAGRYAGPTLEMAKAAGSELRITPAEALVRANALAARGDLAASDRRRLAALFVAAAEPFSATVQWMRLPKSERRAGDGVNAALATRLDRFVALRSELSSVAARVAADVGLERVYGAGDHSSDVVIPPEAAMNAAIKSEPGIIAKFNHDTPEFRAIPEDAMQMSSAAEVMPVMKWKNSAQFGIMDAEVQWISMLRSSNFGAVGRQRVAAWEAQNLKMAVAIREATASIAGGRALLVVGAAHKPFIEAYLRTFTDIDLVSVPDMLEAKSEGCAS